MNIKSELDKAGIFPTVQIDNLIVNFIAKDVSRRIVETFPNFDLTETDIFNELNKLNMYKAKMSGGMVEASYFYKNSSIYFNEIIDTQDLSEFAIHECIHHLQEIKDKKNNLIKMGLCDYSSNSSHPVGLALNEASVQYMSCRIIGIEPDFEKYYDINLFTPSPSYYALECTLLNEIVYFTGTDILFKSTLFSTDDFKNQLIEMTSPKIFANIQNSFDKLLRLEEDIAKISNKIASSKNNDTKLNSKLEKYRQKIAHTFLSTQNIIIKNLFDYKFNKIENLEQLEHFRRELSNFNNIIGKTENYDFFDNYYILMMNNLEHKCNILENGGTETALSNKKHNKLFSIFQKLLNIFSKNDINEI